MMYIISGRRHMQRAWGMGHGAKNMERSVRMTHVIAKNTELRYTGIIKKGGILWTDS